MNRCLRRGGPFLAIALMSACVTSSDPVSDLVRNRASRDGQRVQVTGLFLVSHRYANLYAQNRRLCIGLVLRAPSDGRRQALHGRRVRVSGTVQAEGCGRNGFCDERLCGPAILQDVTVEPLD